jgi:hypothetical protein
MGTSVSPCVAAGAAAAAAGAAADTAATTPTAGAGPAKHCPPRHPTHTQTTLLELNSHHMTWGGRQILLLPFHVVQLTLIPCFLR